MPVAKKTKSSVIDWVSGAQAFALFDARARRVLNMSGTEFMEKWKAGKFKNMDSGNCPGVIGVALLAPKSGDKRGRKKQSGRKR